MPEEGFRHSLTLTRTAGANTTKQVRRIYFTTSGEDDAARAASQKSGLTYSEWTRRAIRAAVLAQGGDPAAMEPYQSIEERAKARDQKVGAGVLTRKLAALRESVETVDVEKALAQVDELMQTVRGR
jgi:hypothetical protein